MTKLRDLNPALSDWDKAQAAASYGWNGNAEVLGRAVAALPEVEIRELRPILKKLIRQALARSSKALANMGIETDLVLDRIPARTHPLELGRREQTNACEIDDDEAVDRGS